MLVLLCPAERFESLFSVVYFSRGAFPQKRNGKRAPIAGDLVYKVAAGWAYRMALCDWL